MLDAIQRGEVDLIISGKRDLLEAAVEEDISYFSTYEAARAALEARRHKGDPIDVQAVQDRPRMAEYWGQPKER